MSSDYVTNTSAVLTSKPLAPVPSTYLFLLDFFFHILDGVVEEEGII